MTGLRLVQSGQVIFIRVLWASSFLDVPGRRSRLVSGRLDFVVCLLANFSVRGGKALESTNASGLCASAACRWQTISISLEAAASRMPNAHTSCRCQRRYCPCGCCTGQTQQISGRKVIGSVMPESHRLSHRPPTQPSPLSPAPQSPLSPAPQRIRGFSAQPFLFQPFFGGRLGKQPYGRLEFIYVIYI